MDAKDCVFVFAIWLLSLGLFGSLTFCVWNKQTEVSSQLADVQNELHSKFQSELQNKLKSELEDVHNELHKLQNELKNLNSRMHVGASEPSQDKAQLKRNVRQADEDTDMLSATEILTNALTEIIERKLVSYMNCDKNKYNHTKCTLKPGPEGETGPEGPIGEKGTKGEQGDMGHRGKSGDKGAKGNPGFTGYKGEKGQEGLVGPQGPLGPTGPQGPRGIQGETGERGDMGQKGEPGNKGVKGDHGFPGNKGEKGKEGVAGAQGLPGPTGPQGPPGIQGKDGQKGEQGLLGPKGDIGPHGPTGEKGDKGDMGERGLKGDMGPPGERGDTGQKGEPGDQGMTGNPGSKGEKGQQGIAGPPGPRDLRAPTTTATPGQCGGPGWRRVVFLNMANTSHVCPTGLGSTTYSRRTCGRAHSSIRNCSSTTFSVGGSQYSRVCGRALAYRFGRNFAFWPYIYRGERNLDSQYVDGLSLTHGAPGSRQHIWTFASGLFVGSHSNGYRYSQCPCDNNNNTSLSPPFVGNDYFCESISSQVGRYHFYPSAVLWDGQVCEGGGTCCKLNNPPWFTKNLANSTTEDIELRLCLYEPASRSNIALEQLELYVQ